MAEVEGTRHKGHKTSPLSLRVFAQVKQVARWLQGTSIQHFLFSRQIEQVNSSSFTSTNPGGTEKNDFFSTIFGSWNVTSTQSNGLLSRVHLIFTGLGQHVFCTFIPECE